MSPFSAPCMVIWSLLGTLTPLGQFIPYLSTLALLCNLISRHPTKCSTLIWSSSSLIGWGTIAYENSLYLDVYIKMGLQHLPNDYQIHSSLSLHISSLICPSCYHVKYFTPLSYICIFSLIWYSPLYFLTLWYVLTLVKRQQKAF